MKTNLGAFGHPLIDIEWDWDKQPIVYKRGKVCVPSSTNDYQLICISDNTRRSTLYVHRMVALAAYGEPQGDRRYVNHKDGNKRNNSANNLEWCSAKENVKHAKEMGLITYRRSVLDDAAKHYQELLQHLWMNSPLTTSQLSEFFMLPTNVINHYCMKTCGGRGGKIQRSEKWERLIEGNQNA